MSEKDPEGLTICPTTLLRHNTWENACLVRMVSDVPLSEFGTLT